MISRDRRTPLSQWWWTVDRLLLAALTTLILGGIILSLAASPPVATRIGLDPFHFFNRHVMFILPAFAVMIGISFLSPRQVRRSALIMFAISVVLLAATLVFGAEVKGSRRWISIAGISIQASEFAKPAFVVVVAWLFSESARRPEMPATSLALAALLLVVALLVLEPDFGQTHADPDGVGRAVLHGRHAHDLGRRPCRRGGRRTVRRLPVRAARGAAHQALHGPGLRRHLPGRHGDRSPSCAAAGSGRGRARAPSSASCPTATPTSCSPSRPKSSASSSALRLVALFAFIVIRSLKTAYRTEDLFTRFAASGLAILFGIQSAINMAVNLHLIPAKGMTLPFISYGGSSMISLAYGMGMLLALTRQRSAIELEATGGAGFARSYA